MKRKDRVIAVFSAVAALALLGALCWHSAGPAGSGRVGLQPEEMTKIVAGFKPKPKPKPTPTPTPDPLGVDVTIRVMRPAGWRTWMCTVWWFDQNGNNIGMKDTPLCLPEGNANGYAKKKNVRLENIGFVEGFGTEVSGLNGTMRCRSGKVAFNRTTFQSVPCNAY